MLPQHIPLLLLLPPLLAVRYCHGTWIERPSNAFANRKRHVSSAPRLLTMDSKLEELSCEAVSLMCKHLAKRH